MRKLFLLSFVLLIYILALPLIGIVPDDEKVISSTNTGEPVVRDEKSHCAQAYRNIAQRVLGKEVEYLDISVKKGFFKRIFG